MMMMILTMLKEIKEKNYPGKIAFVDQFVDNCRRRYNRNNRLKLIDFNGFFLQIFCCSLIGFTFDSFDRIRFRI